MAKWITKRGVGEGAGSNTFDCCLAKQGNNTNLWQPIIYYLSGFLEWLQTTVGLTIKTKLPHLQGADM